MKAKLTLSIAATLALYDTQNTTLYLIEYDS